MSAILIVLLAVLVLVIAALAVGRSTYEVESARDTEYLELEGDWVRYNVIGGGPPVVLVHGWLSSSAVWDQLAQRLSQRFTVYTLDMPGFGESDKPIDGYGVRYGSRLLYAFCAHFGLTRVSVIGHDLGGDMAMKLASDHPDIAGRIVLVATPANEEQIDLPTSLWAATLPVVGPLFYALGRSVRSMRTSWMRAFVSEPDDVTDEMIGDAGSSTPAAMSKTLSVSKREIAGGRLARQSRMVRVPVLIITGEEDQIVDPQAAGIWSKSLEQSEVCLMDECGHMPMIERTGEFNAQILAFLTGDARYLEYTEQQSRAPSSSGIDTEEDTIEVGTLPPEGEDPAFGEEPAFGTGLFSPGGRRDDNDDAEEPEDRQRRRGQPGRPGDRLEEDEGRDKAGDAAHEETERNETASRAPFEEPPPVPPPAPETTAPAARDDEIGSPGASEQVDSNDDEDDEERPRVVRRFGGRPSSNPPAHRRPGRPWDFDEVEEDDPDASTGRIVGGSEPEADSPQVPQEEESRDELSGERIAERDERPRARRIRRPDADGGGSVPEVPDDLFDWGNSLDDFEPVDRDRRRRRPDDTGDDAGAPDAGDHPSPGEDGPGRRKPEPGEEGEGDYRT